MRVDSYLNTEGTIEGSFVAADESFYMYTSNEHLFLVPGWQTPAWSMKRITNDPLYPTTGLFSLYGFPWAITTVSFNNVTNDGS